MSSVTRPHVGRGWYYGWNVVAIGILSQVAANGLTYNSFSLFLRDWSTEMHTPISRLQLSIAAMVLPSALLAPFIGSLADKYPARALCACGLLGIACFYFAISMTTAGWQIVALYGLLAPLPLVLATAVTVNTVVSRWFVHRRGLALGLSSFGVGMAGIVLPPLIAAALPAFGWRMIWRVGGLVLALLVMPLVVVVMRHQPTEREGLHYLSSDGRSQPHHDEASKDTQPTLREILAQEFLACDCELCTADGAVRRLRTEPRAICSQPRIEPAVRRYAHIRIQLVTSRCDVCYRPTLRPVWQSAALCRPRDHNRVRRHRRRLRNERASHYLWECADRVGGRVTNLAGCSHRGGVWCPRLRTGLWPQPTLHSSRIPRALLHR